MEKSKGEKKNLSRLGAISLTKKLLCKGEKYEKAKNFVIAGGVENRPSTNINKHLQGQNGKSVCPYKNGFAQPAWDCTKTTRRANAAPKRRVQ